MEQEEEKVAHVDMDGTVADYDAAMKSELVKLMSPAELEAFTASGEVWGDEPHLGARRHLIKVQPGFWRKLPRIERGFEVVEVIRQIGFTINVLTKGPKLVPSAWQQKVEWAQEQMPYAEMTITQNKSRAFGHVLVDDWPDYFGPWLKVRPRGLVIAVAQPWNEKFEHPNFIRYDGTNLEAVRERAQRAFDRQPGEAM